MKNFFLVVFYLFGFSLAQAQEEMSKAQKDFIWTLRVKAVEDFKRTQTVSAEIIAELKKHFNLASGEERQEFKMAFYLERDVENEEFRKKLSDIYGAFLSSNTSEFEAQLKSLNQSGVTEQEPEKIVKPKPGLVSGLPKISLDPKIPGFGEDPCQAMGTPAARRKCMEANAKFQASRIVLDPGHFGGEYAKGQVVRDSRETPKGYREGYGTFVTAAITKWCLENCFGAKPQNILLTRWDLTTLGHEKISNPGVSQPSRKLDPKEIETPQSDSMAYRSDYIRGLSPNLFISLHSNATGVSGSTTQRVEIFHLRNPTQKNDKAYDKSVESYNNSVALAKALEAGFEESYGASKDPTGLSRKEVMKISGALDTRTLEKDYRIFYSMLKNGSPEVKMTPMVLVEGFFHDTLEDELLTAQNKSGPTLPKIQMAGQDFSFHRAHQWYAEAVVAGIARFYGCADGEKPEASGTGNH
jgi:N-acetylmuramoyl-L-alanine amidase